MSTDQQPARPTVTEPGKTLADMARALDPILYPHLNPLTQGWPRLMQITRQVRLVFDAFGWVRPEVVAAREAAARREAVIEELAGAAAEWDELEQRGHDPLSCADVAGNLRARIAVLQAEGDES